MEIFPRAMLMRRVIKDENTQNALQDSLDKNHSTFVKISFHVTFSHVFI